MSRGVSPVLAEVLLVAVAVVAALAVYYFVVSGAVPQASAPLFAPAYIDSVSYRDGNLLVMLRGVSRQSLAEPMIYVYDSAGNLLGGYVPLLRCADDLCTLSAKVFLSPGYYRVDVRSESIDTSAPFRVDGSPTVFECNSCTSCTRLISGLVGDLSFGQPLTVLVSADISSAGSPCISIKGPGEISGALVIDLNGHTVSASSPGYDYVVDVNDANVIIEHGVVKTGDLPCLGGIRAVNSHLVLLDVNVYSSCSEGSHAVYVSSGSLLFDLRAAPVVLCDNHDALGGSASVSCVGNNNIYLVPSASLALPESCELGSTDQVSCGSVADEGVD